MASKSYKRWDINDKLFLINSINNNMNFKDIAIKLERSEYSIKTQIDAILNKISKNYNDEYNNFLIIKI